MTPLQPNVPDLLRRYGIHPDRRLGQNFLVDPAALARVVEAADVGKDTCVLEIGAGVGNLTTLLAERAGTVVAVELDDRLIPALQEVLSPFPNVNIVQGDILELYLTKIIDQPAYQVVANIPYYITSALIRHLLEADLKPAKLTLTVQREVAQRICAAPGNLSLLALSVQVYGEPVVAARIPAGAFYPPPKVDSSVVNVSLFPTPFIPYPLLTTFFRLAKAGFSQKRKTLRNALAGGMHWEPVHAQEVLLSAGIDPQRRAQTLSLQEWESLTSMVHPLPKD